MDVCKCIEPSRHGGTLNNRRGANPLVRLVEEEERWETPDDLGVFSLKIGKEMSKIELSPTWCSKLMLTTGAKFCLLAAINFADFDPMLLSISLLAMPPISPTCCSRIAAAWRRVWDECEDACRHANFMLRYAMSYRMLRFKMIKESFGVELSVMLPIMLNPEVLAP
ncbi:hypothetical protein TNCV_404781 [Trichonephila clavipes]|nr:hypothetical protein TNCV_404781 [Trichonephila clavipes]